MFVHEKITTREAAAFLECSEETLLEELRNGRVPGLKIGKAWVIPRPAFFEAMNERARADAAILNPQTKIARANAGRPRLARSA